MFLSLDAMAGLAIAIVVLGFLIIVHEFGHFLFAKRLGIGVLKFSVGFGPKIFGRTANGTEYALSLIPLGGFVKMVGEDAESEDADFDPKVSFSHQPLWKRLLVVAAGPVFNLVFAFFLFSLVFALYGIQLPTESPRIGEVMKEMPAARAGLRADDLVSHVDGQAIAKWKDLSNAIRTSGGREVELTVRREGGVVTLRVTAEHKPEKNLFGEVVGEAYLIGIAPGSEWERVGVIRAVREGADYTVFWIRTTFMSLVKLAQGKIGRDDIGGPIAIVQGAKKQAQKGLEDLMHFMAVISINLGVLNLLPIPVLDGGHIFFFLVEAVLRRPLQLRHREIAQQIGLVLLVGLMAFAFYNDIARIVRGWG